MFAWTWTLAACESAPEQPRADPIVAAPADEDPLVGYDLRRLRPVEDEPLAAMFDRVQAAARDEGKRVVVMFSADWCEPCKRIDLELGNVHPASMIGDVRILELKEDDWKLAARMDEYNDLRARWEPVAGVYPLVVLLDDQGKRSDEMKEAKQRLEAEGLEATLPIWLASTR
ncbi:thioredoxin domain-containing protein [Nannocystaceae bacterium ST9]